MADYILDQAVACSRHPIAEVVEELDRELPETISSGFVLREFFEWSVLNIERTTRKISLRFYIFDVLHWISLDPTPEGIRSRMYRTCGATYRRMGSSQATEWTKLCEDMQQSLQEEVFEWVMEA